MLDVSVASAACSVAVWILEKCELKPLTGSIHPSIHRKVTFLLAMFTNTVVLVISGVNSLCRDAEKDYILLDGWVQVNFVTVAEQLNLKASSANKLCHIC